MKIKGSWVYRIFTFAFILPVVMDAGEQQEKSRIDVGALPPAVDLDVDFVRDVEPILRQACHSCHGAKRQRAGLRLDVAAEALRGGDSGMAIVPGKSGESALIHRVAGLDPKTIMPPKGTPLTAEQVGVLRAWIDAGAVWSKRDGDDTRLVSDHWAFQKIDEPSVPTVAAEQWVKNVVDTFVLSRLEKESIEPSPPASRATLLRRLSLDLTGLPPTSKEVTRFLADDGANAYERVVDRLLSSPYFGERWGRYWLDLARYADSDGYEKDRIRPHAWRYRNWVIEAINADQPFDEFTLHQLAGDLLDAPTREKKIATGFHRNTLTNTEGGTDQEEFRVKATVDRTNTTGSVWLGLTVGCAQCHSHKYDPISQRDYYELFAFFNTVKEVNIPAPLGSEMRAYRQKKAVYDAELAKLHAAVEAVSADDLAPRQARWQKHAGTLAEWEVLKPQKVTSRREGVTTEVKEDASVLVGGNNPSNNYLTVSATTPLKKIVALRLEALTDGSLPKNGPGRSPDGEFVLTGFEVSVAAASSDAEKEGEATRVALYGAAAEASAPSTLPSDAYDGDSGTGWSPPPRDGSAAAKPAKIVFEITEPLEFETGTRLIVTVRTEKGSTKTLGRFRLSAISAPPDGRVVPATIRAILAREGDKRSTAESKQLANFYRDVDSEIIQLRRIVEEFERTAPPEPETEAQTLAEHTPRRKTHVLTRGDFLRPDAEVGADTLSVLPPMMGHGEMPDRLDLVNWLMDPENPLTARVAVNRIWHRLFGRGLVATPEDFGTRGEKPSHPELLDWLAGEYRRRGWGMKSLIRLIVLSSTYRQSSDSRPELQEVDSQNRLLARQNRYRLQAEAVRDVFLASSGLLSHSIGGRSIRPPLPSGVRELLYAGSMKWPESEGHDRYRRGLYIFFQRTVPYPMLMTFDAPDSNVSCVRRQSSNTPLQALTLLNDPVFFECAQALGLRVLREAAVDLDTRIEHLFLVTVGRRPQVAELDAVRKLHAELLALSRIDAEETAKLVGAAQVDDPALAAVWITLARMTLNLDETISRS